MYTDRALNHMSAPFKKVTLPLPLPLPLTLTLALTLTLTLIRSYVGGALALFDVAWLAVAFAV